MAFQRKTWYDAPNPLTPLNAAGLNDMEDRLAVSDMGLINVGEEPYAGDLESARDAALAEGRAVYIPPGLVTYEGITPLAWYAEVPILGLSGSSAISFPNIPNTDPGLTFYGSQSAGIDLDADVIGGDTQLTLDTSTLQAGDYLLLRDPDTVIVPEGTASGNRKTEFVQVYTVDDATTVTLTTPLLHSYTTAANSVAHPTTLADNPRISGVDLYGPDDPGVAIIGIEFQDCLMPYVKESRAFACNNRGLNYIRCLGGGWDTFEAKGTVGTDDGNGSQYGVGVVESCQNIVGRRTYAEGLRHATAIGGDTCNTVIIDTGIAKGMWNAGFDAHPGSCDIRYKTLRVHGTTGPTDSASADGITMQSSWFTIEDAYLTDLWRHGLTVQPQDTFDTRGKVRDVTVERPGRHVAATGRAFLVSTQQSTIDTEYLNMDDLAAFNFPGAGFEVNPNGVENEGPELLRRLRVEFYGESPIEGAHVMRLNYCKSPRVHIYADASRARRGFRADFCEDVELNGEIINDDSSSSDIAVDLRSVTGGRISVLVRPGGEGGSTGVDTGLKFDDDCSDIEVFFPRFESVTNEIIWGTGAGHSLVSNDTVRTTDHQRKRILLPAGLASSASALALTANRAYLIRHVPTIRGPVATAFFEVTTASGTDDPCQIGVYDANLDKIAGSAETTGLLNSTGLKQISFTATKLDPGEVYYVAFAANSTASVRGTNNLSTLMDAFGSASPDALILSKTSSYPLPASIASPTQTVNVPLLVFGAA